MESREELIKQIKESEKRESDLINGLVESMKELKESSEKLEEMRESILDSIISFWEKV
jgi:hypothetical protein